MRYFGINERPPGLLVSLAKHGVRWGSLPRQGQVVCTPGLFSGLAGRARLSRCSCHRRLGAGRRIFARICWASCSAAGRNAASLAPGMRARRSGRAGVAVKCPRGFI